MDLKTVIVITVSVLLTRGNTFPLTDGLRSFQASQLKYNLNMTSMWMTDDQGRITEVYLTGRPHHSHLPVANVAENVYYFLYTREYNSAYQLMKFDVDRLRDSTWNPNRPTKVMVHGFMSSYQSDAVQLVREAYLKSQDVNVVGVDWSALAIGPWYVEAADHTEPVGEEVAQMIDFLVSVGGSDIEDFHLLGHSLGSHVMAFASNHITTGRILRITGLDPALPLFSGRPPDRRLDPTDADTVDCIHTCGGYLGFYTPLCSHDFYPNGGTASQPGCHWDITGACSHGRSYRYFSESIENLFSAKSCTSFDEVKSGRCTGNSTGTMGDLALKSKPGLYYLQTNSNYPYVKT